MNTKTAHTPGPWCIDQYVGEDRTFIVQGPTPIGAPQLVADHIQPKDANLIAAAPLLLEALESAHDRLWDHGLCLCDEGAEKVCEAVVAIAAARGEV